MPFTLAGAGRLARRGDRVLLMGIGSGLNASCARDRLVTARPDAARSTRPPGCPGSTRPGPGCVDVADADGVEPRPGTCSTTAPTGDPVGTLLCVHGNPTWSYLWRRLLAAAPPGWRVVAVDQLGMGFSERLGAARGRWRSGSTTSAR